jgi:hypothetical protein
MATSWENGQNILNGSLTQKYIQWTIVQGHSSRKLRLTHNEIQSCPSQDN